MKICRFTLAGDNTPRLGVMTDNGIHDVTAATDKLPNMRWPLPPGDALIAHLDDLRPEIERLAQSSPAIARDQVKLQSPVANPGKFVCGVGNWKFHGAPLGMMGFLFKMTSAGAGEGDGVQLRWPDRTTLHEPELATIIGKTCTNVSVEDALDYVAGYSCALDMTMKEEKEFFTFCKSFDTYGMMGPCLVTADEIPDPGQLGYKFWVNDELRGERSFSDLTASPAELVAFASTVMTLHPGDVIFSGAADVDAVGDGDIMRLDIPGVGRMDVPVSISPHARSGPPGPG